MFSPRSRVNTIMTNFDIEAENARGARNWDGLSELDQALHDNRLMAYRIRKSWADPWGRRLTIFGLTLIGTVFVFLAGASFGLW
jgi:hypothetical protein